MVNKLMIDARLLAASNVPAAVSGVPIKAMRQPCPSAPGWNDLVGWDPGAPGPKTFFDGLDAINAAIVGRIPEGVVVAFRGTLQPFDATKPFEARLRDWVQDFDGLLVEAEPPGLVHAGFMAGLKTLWADVAAEVESLLKPGDKLYLTGHSKGGAMAVLAAMSLPFPHPQLVVTFAAPRAGNDVFESAFSISGIVCRRYEAGDDIVPHLAPESRLAAFLASIIGPGAQGHGGYDYQPVGNLSYVREDGSMISPTPDSPQDHLLAARRNVSLMETVVLGEFPRMIAEHGIGCGSAYQKALCPGVAA